MKNDLISREAAIATCYEGWGCDTDTIRHIVENIRRIPSVSRKELNEDCEIALRWWENSNGEAIREWTIDEYVRWNPKNNKILPYKTNDKTINVEAHCVEARRIFATKNGQRRVVYEGRIDYSKDSNKSVDKNKEKETICIFN